MNNIYKFIQYFVLKTNNIWLLEQLYFLLYECSLRFIVAELSKFPEVVSIYSRGSIATGNYTPGSSDIDLIVVTKNLTPTEEISYYKKFHRKYSLLRSIFPFFMHYNTMDENTLGVYTKLISGPTNHNRLKILYGEDRIKSRNIIHQPASKDYFSYCWNKFIYLTNRLYTVTPGNYVRHHTKAIFEILEHISESNESSILKIRRDLEKQCLLIKESNFFSDNPHAYLIESWGKTLVLLDKISPILLRDSKKNEHIDKVSPKLRLTRYELAQETQGYMVERALPFVEELKQCTEQYMDSIILNSPENRNYEYSLYVILRDGIGLEEIKNVTTKIIGLYEKYKKGFSFLMGFPPRIMTKDISAILLRKIGKPELLCLVRHGKVLYGDDSKAKLYGDIKNYFNNVPVENFREILIGAPFGTNIIESLIVTTIEKNIPKMIKRIDFLCAVIPAKRILLEKGIITTTPRETFEEYMNYYATDKYTEWYASFYNKFYCSLHNDIPLKEIIAELGQGHLFLRHNIDIITKLAGEIK